jgi:Cu/Ag efflux protein CusF
MKILKILATAAAIAVSTSAALAGDVVWTRGEVTKVDTGQSKVTVKHEEISNLDMPAMTMVFFVPDPTVLKGLKPGQKKEFEFGSMNGRMVVKQVR